MQGHRAYLDLGRRTAPSSNARQFIGRKWHRQWSSPLALAAATGTAKTAKLAECEASQSGPKGNAHD